MCARDYLADPTTFLLALGGMYHVMRGYHICAALSRCRDTILVVLPDRMWVCRVSGEGSGLDLESKAFGARGTKRGNDVAQ